ncbi:hypothetical protein OGAPHI_002407 [Ogataea philodendri]|uniref:MATE efflux family protein n=1 Tax=Ogataea philodendri TaxID=1378263 RepID=A0A9P8PAL5_9ASCO|nr:uncharacterized protein OGAPHI_002407 [Ogataea philodendri]KAH3668653.1 hypothetical protein OGAPHI_002407 [Ogataea philodendri]
MSLIQDADRTPNYDAINDTDVQELSETRYDRINELQKIFKDSVPLVLTNFMQDFLAISPLMVISRVSTQALAAASLATMFMNITCLGVIQGAVTSVESFAPHAYGAGNYSQVGEVVQKNLAVNILLLIPSALLCWHSGPILGFLQPDQELAHLAQTYLRIVFCGIPGLLIFELGKRYLQAQQIFHASTYALIVVSPLSLISLYVFTFTFGLGFYGAPIVVAASFWAMGLFLVGYVLLVDGKQCWHGFIYKRMFVNISDQLYLALFSLVGIEAEYIAYEAMALAAAYFGETSLAAQSICSSVGSLVFQVPLALSSSISTRVGSHIGSGNEKFARDTTYLCIKTAFVLGLTITAVLTIFMKPITAAFTNDPEVAVLCYRVLPLLNMTQTYDTANAILQGLLRSQRRQDVGSAFNLSIYYLIGVPLAYWLAFGKSYGIYGLWIAFTISVFLLTAVELVLILRTNWKAVMEIANEEEEES